MTHAELVTRAAKWLANNRKCVVVLTECGSQCSSIIPDAIGWTARGQSVLIECKTSVSDFRADRHKPAYRGGRFVGQVRYYMTPPGLLTKQQVGDPWGLLEARPNQVRVIKSAALVTVDRDEEMKILLAETRRVVEGFRASRPSNGIFLEAIE